MRVSLGQMSTEPVITLIDGTVITSPSTTAPTDLQCRPYQCGGDAANVEALMWCSLWGQASAFPCSDVQCDPVRTYLNCPTVGVYPPPAASPDALPSPAPLPISAANIVPNQPNIQLPALTPANIAQPMPDITASIAPQAVNTCSWLDSAIAGNPVMALALLAAGTFLLWPKGRRA
jgi:hypothetical protein